MDFDFVDQRSTGYGTRQQYLRVESRGVICCSSCKRPTTESYSFRASPPGKFPAIYKCARCGGRPSNSQETRLSKTMDYINHWSVILPFKVQEKARAEAASNFQKHEAGSRNRFNPKNIPNGRFLNELNSRGAEWAAKLKVEHAFNVRLQLGAAFGNRTGPDLGEFYQVRSTTLLFGYLPLSQFKAHPDHVYIQVVGTFPSYRLTGWIFAAEAILHTEWYTLEDPPFWKVPQEELYWMETLPQKQEEVDLLCSRVDWEKINRLLKQAIDS